MQVNLENNKYTLIFDETKGTLVANRYGEYWMDYTGSKLLYSLMARITELEALSVTNILLDVVPSDGSGLEIFAKSTSDIVDLLSKMDEKIEDFELSKQTQQVAVPLSDEQIESFLAKTFSTGNSYCPVDSKSMRKAARAIEAHHGIK